MKRKPKTPGSRPRQTSEPVRELPPERAFVLHLDARAQLPRRMIARIEHVTSGRVTHVTSLPDLLAFLADVLRRPTSED